MDDSKFFKWVWRTNALLILLVSLLVFVSFIYERYKSMSRHKTEEPVLVSVADDPKGMEKWALGNSTDIIGYNLIMLPLVSENKEANVNSNPAQAKMMDSAYLRRSTAKNILFINTVSSESYWLFSGVNQLIFNASPFFYADRPNDGKRNVEAIFYEIVLSDSNKDKVLNSDDALSLGVSKPDGSEFNIIISQFDKIITKTQAGDDKVLLVYQSDGVGYSMLLQMDEFKILSKKELPKVSGF